MVTFWDICRLGYDQVQFMYIMGPEVLNTSHTNLFDCWL